MENRFTVSKNTNIKLDGKTFIIEKGDQIILEQDKPSFKNLLQSLKTKQTKAPGQKSQWIKDLPQRREKEHTRAYTSKSIKRHQDLSSIESMQKIIDDINTATKDGESNKFRHVCSSKTIEEIWSHYGINLRDARIVNRADVSDLEIPPEDAQTINKLYRTDLLYRHEHPKKPESDKKTSETPKGATKTPESQATEPQPPKKKEKRAGGIVRGKVKKESPDIDISTIVPNLTYEQLNNIKQEAIRNDISTKDEIIQSPYSGVVEQVVREQGNNHIIIETDENIKTVYLGTYLPAVKTHNKVRVGDIIGISQDRSKILGSAQKEIFQAVMSALQSADQTQLTQARREFYRLFHEHGLKDLAEKTLLSRDHISYLANKYGMNIVAPVKRPARQQSTNVHLLYVMSIHTDNNTIVISEKKGNDLIKFYDDNPGRWSHFTPGISIRKPRKSSKSDVYKKYIRPIDVRDMLLLADKHGIEYEYLGDATSIVGSLSEKLNIPIDQIHKCKTCSYFSEDEKSHAEKCKAFESLKSDYDFYVIMEWLDNPNITNSCNEYQGL